MDVVCVGEMVIDFLPGNEPGVYLRNAGGAPANVAIAVARNGFSSGFLGKMGDDDFGRFLVKTLEDNRVAVINKELTSEAITTMAFVTLDEHGDRSFTFARKPGADMLLSVDDVDQEVIQNAHVVHAGSCSLSASPAAEATIFALQYAKSCGKLISFDVNYRNLLWNDQSDAAMNRIREVLPYVDLLKISDEEVNLFGGENRIPQVMADNSISLVIETLGPKGAKAFFKDQVIELEGLPGKAVDTTGAGDAFWGAFISSLLEQGVTQVKQLAKPIIEQAMKQGNVAGTLCVKKKGAISSLPTGEEIKAYLEEAGLS